MRSFITQCAPLSAWTIALVHVSTCVSVAASEEISADRGWHLAAMYYSRYVSGCGGVGAVKEHGHYWIAPVHFGRAGTFRGYIRVDRATGTVSYSWHPTVSAESLEAWFASVTKRPRAP